ELGGLERFEATAERLVRQLGDRAQERKRDILANHRGGLKQALVLRREPVDAGRQDRLDGGGGLERRQWPRQPGPAALARQCSGLGQCPDGLLQEEGIATLDEKLLQGGEARILAEEHIQQLGGALSRQRVEPQLAIGGLIAPGVLVLGAIVHEQEQARR